MKPEFVKQNEIPRDFGVMLEILDKNYNISHLKQISEREKNLRLAERLEAQTQKEIALKKMCRGDRDLIRQEREKARNKK